MQLNGYNIILLDRVVYGNISISNNLITKVEVIAEQPKDTAAYIAPGFIDQHIHGSHGFDTMDIDEKALLTIKEKLPQFGVTAFCPTTMSAPLTAIEKAVNNIRSVQKVQRGAKIIGANIEGPFLAKDYAGAQDPQNIQAINLAFVEKINYDNIIKLMTVSPNLPNYDILIKMAKQMNFNLSIGHTNALYQEINDALDKGVQVFTHGYNAMSKLHHREIGCVGAMLLSDNTYSELILDLHHVSLPAAKLLLKCKGIEHVILITDAMRAQGLGDNIISELGGQKVFVKEQTARLNDGTLAGSIITYDKLFANAHYKLGLSLPACVYLSSTNSARLLGLNQNGQIKAGMLADLVILSPQLQVLKTIVEGRVVYEN